jgi:ferric-dicitrate binding protein FerR (iron transport regulator)
MISLPAKELIVMKLNINKPKHYIIIAKYLAGEMNAVEKDEFEKLASIHPENELLINKMTNYWNRMKMPIKSKEVDTDQAWNNLHRKIKEDTEVVEKANVFRINTHWYSWAAAILLLFAVSSVLFITNILTKDRAILVQTTDDPSILVHTMSDGSVIYLANNTTISYSKNFGKRNRNITLNGEAFFDVMPNQSIPFIIETNNAFVKVIGTSFTLKSNSQDAFELTVESGIVSVSPSAQEGEMLIANAGDRVTMINNSLTKTTISERSYHDWKNRRLQFKDETIFNIIQVINKNYRTNIVLNPLISGNLRITVTFQNNNINSIVEIICATLNLEPKYIDSSIILSPPTDDQ